MKSIPVKSEHLKELSYLLGEMDHLEKSGAPAYKHDDAVRALGRRMLQLYPELKGKRTQLREEGGSLCIVVYESKEEWLRDIEKMTKEENRAQYTALMGNPGAPVIGPHRKP